MMKKDPRSIALNKCIRIYDVNGSYQSRGNLLRYMVTLDLTTKSCQRDELRIPNILR